MKGSALLPKILRTSIPKTRGRALFSMIMGVEEINSPEHIQESSEKSLNCTNHPVAEVFGKHSRRENKLTDLTPTSPPPPPPSFESGIVSQFSLDSLDSLVD